MTAEYIRHSEIIDQLVLNRSTLDELGKVEVLWEYPQAHRVLGFICKSGSFDRHKTAFNLDQLDTIGSNGIMVSTDPVETDAERVRQIQSLVHCEIWTDTGNRVGKIVDHVFHLKTGVVRQYLLTTGGIQGLAGKIYALYPSQILSAGTKRVLVSAAIVNDLEVYQPGLQARIAKFSDVLREEKSQASQGLQSLMSRAKTKAQVLAEQAREQAQTLSAELLESAEQVKGRVRDLSEELRDESRYDDARYDPRSRYVNRNRHAASRSDNDFDNEFDFDQPWEDAAPARRGPSDDDRPQPTARPPESWQRQPIPPRSPLNLDPPSPRRSTPQSPSPPPSASSPDPDPWDDEWN
jgi:uncharacterized protein YrrD